jgi:adenylate cyclase
MAAPARPPGNGVEGTIVFTDLVGFTEFTSARGDAEALQLLATQDRIVRAELPDGARVVKEIGDGLFLWFAHPVAALECSLALHRRFDEESAATGLPLWIRVGIHHGRALPRGADLVGNDVNIAARIVDVAAPGEVLVSDTVRAGVDATAPVCFEEVGPVVMKGIPSPIRLWRVTDERDQRSPAMKAQ